MIEVNQLTYRAAGQPIVDGLTFKVRNGQICGLLGDAASGRAAAIRLIAGVDRPASGRVHINGYDICREPLPAKRQMAYLPADFAACPDMTPFEYISFMAEARGVDGEAVFRSAHEALVATNLVGVQDRLIRHLSTVAVRRLGLAQTLPGNPDTILLDAPLAGLNAKERGEMCGLIKKICKNKTLLVADAPSRELEAICDQVVLMTQGKGAEPISTPHATDASSQQQTPEVTA